MRVEEELRMPREIEKRIRVQLTRIEQIRGSLLPGGYDYERDKVQGGFPGDKYALAMGKITEIEERIRTLEEKKEWYENVRIPLLLDQVFDPEAKTVIYLYDVLMIPMNQTAEILYLSRATAYRLRGKGLADIREFKEKER